jgi:putative inorganic carbon (HCO3(-)) transporter
MFIISILLTVISPYTALIPAVFITYKVFKNKEIIDKNPWNLGLLFLFIWSLISGLSNHDVISALISGIFILYFSISVYLQKYYAEEGKIEKLLRMLVYFSTGAAVFGIIEKIAYYYCKNLWWGAIFGITTYANKAHRIYSTFGNPNVAGSWFACMVLLSIYLASKTTHYKKLFYISDMILFIIVLCLTGSRGAALGLILGLLIYFSFERNKTNFIIILGVSVLMAVLLFAPTQIPVLKNLMGHELDHSISGRQAIWEGCYRMFKAKPLTGWGIMGIWTDGWYYINYYMRENHGHNIWITIATTLGIVGLSVYIYMKYYLFEGIKLLYSQKCRLVPILAGIQAVIIGQGIVDFTIMTPQVGLLFIGCSAIISGLAAQYSGSAVHHTVPAASYNSQY